MDYRLNRYLSRVYNPKRQLLKLKIILYELFELISNFYFILLIVSVIDKPLFA